MAKNPIDLANRIQSETPYYEDVNAVDFLDTKRTYKPDELYDMTHSGDNSPWQLHAYKPSLIHMEHKDTGNGYVFDRTTGKLSPKKYDDYVNEGKEERSKDLLDRYYKGEFDLERLHRELWQNYGDLKTAFEWLAKNGRRY